MEGHEAGSKRISEERAAQAGAKWRMPPLQSAGNGRRIPRGAGVNGESPIPGAKWEESRRNGELAKAHSLHAGYENQLSRKPRAKLAEAAASPGQKGAMRMARKSGLPKSARKLRNSGKN
ncbi:MAG: hypothetical protein LBU32_19515 [Clostridiales bacterium]|jgi:hypothetical protein|nr:hypothetical protein [Clostridiales bacterium]